MRTPFVAGNWKMNTSRVTAVELAAAVAKGAPAGVLVGVAPPFVYLEAVGRTIGGSKIILGAQDVYPGKSGAFTGEISVEMLLDLGVKFCLAGHSERRHVIKEPGDLIAAKAAAIYAGGLILVHCVGETLQERQAGKTLDVVRVQIDELTAKIDDPSRLVIAYEPVWAIGTGLNATEAQAQEVHAHIRELLGRKWNREFAQIARIQYGGSVKAENAAGLMAQADVDGGLVGGAALKSESFLAIALAAATAAGRKMEANRNLHV
jgi:triosephosphate isomerase (TIM)